MNLFYGGSVLSGDRIVLYRQTGILFHRGCRRRLLFVAVAVAVASAQVLLPAYGAPTNFPSLSVCSVSLLFFSEAKQLR